MSVAESLRRAVGYFADSADEGYDDGETIRSPEESERHHQERIHVHRRGRRGGDDDREIYNEESPRHLREARKHGAGHLALAGPPQSEFCLVVTHDFDDAQQIADRLKADTPVIVNMQSCQPELAKRLTDFCSGLTYALEGSLQRIDEKTLLLASGNADLSGTPTAGLLEKGFFNQA